MTLRTAYALLFFLFISPILLSYHVFVEVSLYEGTYAVGTNVAVVKEGIEIGSEKTNSQGIASFNLTNGSYFVQLKRYPYPLHVSLIEVSGHTNVSLSMRQLISYSNAYGQVIGPENFTNVSVSAYSDGEIIKRTAVNRNGYFILSYLPEGNYRIVFEAPGFETKEELAFLPMSQYIEMSRTLEKIPPAPEQVLSMKAVKKAVKYSTIEVKVLFGGEPMAGAKITAQTPSGEIILETDAGGVARINAAEEGEYVFAHANLSATTVVSIGGTGTENKTVGIPVSHDPSKPIVAPEKPPEKDTFFALSASLVVFLALFGIFIIIAAFLVQRVLASKKEKGKQKKAGGIKEAEKKPSKNIPPPGKS